MIWLTVLILPIAWVYLNHVYAGVHGRPLRWQYCWAAQGALLFGYRFREWERHG